MGFNEELARGAILYLEAQGGELLDPSIIKRWKHMVVLSVDTSAAVILGSFLTSKIEKFADKRFDTEILRVPKGSYACLPVDSVLDFRGPIQFQRATLKDRFEKGRLRFEGRLLPAHVKELDDKIRRSLLIFRKYKKLTFTDFT